MLSFRLTKQTSKNVADTIFKKFFPNRVYGWPKTLLNMTSLFLFPEFLASFVYGSKPIWLKSNGFLVEIDTVRTNLEFLHVQIP